MSLPKESGNGRRSMFSNHCMTLLQNIYLKNICIILWHCFILPTSHRELLKNMQYFKQEKIHVPFLFTISKEMLSLKDKIHSICIR